MITEKLKLASDYEKSISRAAELLKKGAVVGIPTETVYGLAANACDDKAISKVFEAKGRPQDNPLIVHIADIKMLNMVAKDIPIQAMQCASYFWPGPLTMVLKRTDLTAKSVSAGLDTIAVRMPENKAACDIIRASGLPLAAPSANTSGKPSPTSAAHVEQDLNGKIDAIVYGEDSAVGVESTVISFCCNPPRLLRPGAVTAEQLRGLIPDLEIDTAVLAQPDSNSRVESPGMKYKHYAPETESVLVSSESSEKFAKLVNGEPASVAVCFKEDISYLKVPYICYGKGDNMEELARNVFSALRDVDEKKAAKAYIHAPSKEGVGLAVYNRLLRAAAFRVIEL